MISKFSTSTKAKIGTLFLIFNMLISIANIIIGIYMLTIYCSSAVITVACFSLFFGIFSLYQLLSAQALTTNSLYLSIFISLAVFAGSIGGVAYVNSLRGCYVIACGKGIDEDEITFNRSQCDEVSSSDEKSAYDNLQDGGSIYSAIPVAFGSIQIIMSAFLAIISFIAVCSAPKKDQKVVAIA